MNAAREILAECQSRGVQLTATAKALRYEAPKGALTPDLLKILKTHKRELMAVLRSRNNGLRDWNAVPSGPPSSPNVEPFSQDHLDVIRAGGKIPVWSDVLGEWLWWVKDEVARRQLLSEGCELAIYTLGELALVAGWDSKSLQDVHATKTIFGLPPV